jgi:hypothetical protein
MDNALPSYFGMKGMIDMRVADILAKQSAMQHKAAVFQAQVAQEQASQSSNYTAVADLTATTRGLTKFMGASMLGKTPHHATWYQPSGSSVIHTGRFLPSIRDPAELNLASTLGKFANSVRRLEMPGSDILVLSQFSINPTAVGNSFL